MKDLLVFGGNDPIAEEMRTSGAHGLGFVLEKFAKILFQFWDDQE